MNSFRWILVVWFLLSASIAQADCFDGAAAHQRLNPLVLRAIAWQESRDQPKTIHHNANGTVDYGMMQINSIQLPVLKKHGITRRALMSACKSVYVAAWLLRTHIEKYGNSWAAVGAYHSETPALRDQYAHRILQIVRTREWLTTKLVAITRRKKSTQLASN
jgi:soluble lytic murein transglycosylase-like protein